MAMQGIPLYTCLLNGQPADAVSARDLYAFLQLKQDFFLWFKYQRMTLDFIKERDFIVVDNFVRPNAEMRINERSGASVRESTQNTKDYFISLDMAYEMAVSEEGDFAEQAGEYLKDCDTPQNRRISIQHHPVVGRAMGQAMDLDAIDLSQSARQWAQVRPADLDLYRGLGKVITASAPDEDMLLLPLHEISKTMETLSLYRDKAIELYALSAWMEQHITNLNAYIKSQFMAH